MQLQPSTINGQEKCREEAGPIPRGGASAGNRSVIWQLRSPSAGKSPNQQATVDVLFETRTTQQDVLCLSADCRQLNSHICLLQTDFRMTLVCLAYKDSQYAMYVMFVTYAMYVM
jgi:hypothetical protein